MKKLLMFLAILALAGSARAGNPYTGNADAPDPAETIVFDVFDSTNGVPATGIKPAYHYVARDIAVDSWQLVADSSGSVSISIVSGEFSAFPPTTFVAGSTATLTALQSTSGTTAAWGTTTFRKGLWLAPNVISVGTLKRAHLVLIGHRL